MTSADINGGLSKDILVIHYVSVPTQPPAIDEKWTARIEQRHPGLEIRWVEVGINSLDERPVSEQHYDGATLACFYHPPPATLLSKVRFVQLTTAGVDRFFHHELYEKPSVGFCTANGAHVPQMAEWVIGTHLIMSHHLLDFAEQMKLGRSRFTLHDVRDLAGQRMGILGYGAIGRQCARLAQAFGMEVYAYTRRERTTPAQRQDDSYCVPGTGDPDGLIPTRWFHGVSRDSIDEFLAQDLDLLILSLPLTEATRHVLGPKQFEILARKKTFVSNVARGGHIDQDALLAALHEGKIRGAALDVSEPEPLPEGHPLLSAPNIFITPHISWQSPSLYARILSILEDNLDKLAKGEPLINVVDKEHNY